MKLFENKHFVLGLVSILVLSFDIFTKNLVSTTMTLGESIYILPVLEITYLENIGAGFGILQGMATLLIFIAILVIGLIFYFFNSLPDKKHIWIAAGLIIGGAAGNAISRIFDRVVIDFIDLKVWPVFNIADAALTVGVLMIIVYFLFEK